MTLTVRFNELVTRLRVLSEVDSASIVPFSSSHGKPDSKAPAGAKPDRGGAPHPDHDPLIVWFLHKFDNCKPGAEQEACIVEAELRLEARKHRQPGRNDGSIDPKTPQYDKDRERRIAEDYEGLTPHHVKAIEEIRAGWLSIANVRLVRIRAGRDPDNGRLGVPTEDIDYAFQLKAEGYSVRSIGMRMGKDPRTIRAWLDRRKKEAA